MGAVGVRPDLAVPPVVLAIHDLAPRAVRAVMLLESLADRAEPALRVGVDDIDDRVPIVDDDRGVLARRQSEKAGGSARCAKAS